MRVLVDSSVWIDHLRGVRTRETAILNSILERLDPASEYTDQATELLVADLVLCEVLRGIPDPAEHTTVRDVLLSFELVTIGGVGSA